MYMSHHRVLLQGTQPSGIMTINKKISIVCRAKKGTNSKLQTPPVTFRDVAGLDTAKEELLEVVACLRDARRYARLNAKTPSGVLLTGPPGTGKTLLGKSQAIRNPECSIL
jgi:ATP-dependent Zn protease